MSNQKGIIDYVVDKVIKTPYMADSITQGTLAAWEKQVGDFVSQDETVANIETDKVSHLIPYKNKTNNSSSAR